MKTTSMIKPVSFAAALLALALASASPGEAGPGSPEAILDSVDDFEREVEGSQNFWFLRTRDIRPGEEILTGYGRLYDYAFMRRPAVRRYFCRRLGIDGIPAFDFCLAFSFFRMAAIVQGVKKRGLDGNASNPERALKMGTYVPVFARKGMEAATGG